MKYVVAEEDFINTNQDKNLAAASTDTYQNMMIWRYALTLKVLMTIENKPIENHINEIIRLSSPK